MRPPNWRSIPEKSLQFISELYLTKRTILKQEMIPHSFQSQNDGCRFVRQLVSQILNIERIKSMQKSHSSKVNRSNIRPVAQPRQQEQPPQVQMRETNIKSQNVKVSVRLRPMNQLQSTRGDGQCLKVQSQKLLHINHNYEFNQVLEPMQNQAACYNACNINQFVDAAIDGYSATVFAYGQTGSGKTYTMAGKEELFTREVYRTDQREGIIPRAIQYLWKQVQGNRNCTIKASYTEIYNQQIRDLLNLQSGVLHCRWNPSNGFFVEDLIVVDCSTVDDMIMVLNEGMKNRHSGSHQLNKDSSRSHSILTLYIISEGKSSSSKSVKRYGKISFVDLAGSQRLKESKSQGDMIKETGSINKSLFTLGKVIKGLTDKKVKSPYIPYRDSKLTMLLMDSLGGNSKALMIACTSPSSVYFDQTLSTLNYAARTMNIRNKPIIQMDQKEQIIQEIQGEIDALRKENVYLREQYQRINKGLPIRIPEFDKNAMTRTLKLDISHSTQLPPIQKELLSAKGDGTSYSSKIKGPGNKKTENLISEYQLKFEQLKKENELMRRQKEESEQLYRKLMDTNTSIQSKLQNLQQIFLNKKKDEGARDEVVTSSLLTENTELKKKLREVQKEKMELGWERSMKNLDNNVQLQDENTAIQKEIERLQIREKDLLQELQKKR